MLHKARAGMLYVRTGFRVGGPEGGEGERKEKGGEEGRREEAEARARARA